MYWQAYLHKTSLVAELILTRILKRAKELTLKGIILPCSDPLFLQNKLRSQHSYRDFGFVFLN
jgi:HD superfamily phosphohydrolase